MSASDAARPAEIEIGDMYVCSAAAAARQLHE